MRRLILLKNQTVIAEKCSVAASFWARLVGLMGRSALNTGEALWIPGCNSIHTGMMRFSIDVLFLAKTARQAGQPQTYRITSIREGIKPWKLIPVCDFKASETVELATPGVAQLRKNCDLKVGDEVCLS